jgi:hypothetical protein
VGDAALPDRAWLRALIAPALLLLCTVFLLAYQVGSRGTTSLNIKPVPPTPGATFQIGVTTAPLSRNWWRPWDTADLSTVNAFEQDAGKHAAIVMWYADWAHNSRPAASQLQAVARRHSIPEITWEPWDASKGAYRSQPRYRLRNIVSGQFDPYIWAWARDLAAWHRPVQLRFGQEMDGNWFPWDDYANGNRPGEFVQAWRHVHRIFELAGATNVQWVWSPAFGTPALFPGTRFVDIMATTCQNGGRRLFARGWQTFERTCGKAIHRMHLLAPRLPIQLAEASSGEAGGSKAGWIQQMFAYIGTHPEVTSLVWFNVVKETDWRIESSRTARRQFALDVHSSKFD